MFTDALRRRCTLVLVWMALAPQRAAANAGPVYQDAGAGGAVLPRSTDEVRIVSEHLEFVEGTEMIQPPARGGDAWLPWHVRADYVLENLTAEAVELDVGFPVVGERGWRDVLFNGETYDLGSWLGGRGETPFRRSFHARLDGTELRSRFVRQGCEEQPCYPYLFLFHIALEAHAQASLTVEYDQAPSRCCDESAPRSWVDYILETGALWAGTIGELEIVYRFAVPPTAAHESSAYRNSQGVEEREECAGVATGTGVVLTDTLAGPTIGTDETIAMRIRGSSGDPPRWFLGYAPCAPSGFAELWEPPVRFDYAFACEDERIVLRLEAADVEPGGNISLGMIDPLQRLDNLDEGAGCAVVRTRRGGGADSWSTWRRHLWEDTETTEEPLDGPPPEWHCAIESLRPGYHFDCRFDCCCAAVADTVPWYPRPSATGAGASDGGESDAVQDVAEPADADADAAQDVAEPADAEADAARDVAPEPGAEEAASGIVAPPTSANAGAGPDIAAEPTPHDARADASSRSPSSGSGCRCAAVGGELSSPGSLALLASLLLPRLRRRSGRPS